MYFMRRLHIHCRNLRGVKVETFRFGGGSCSGGVASARTRQWPISKKKAAKRKARGYSFEHEGRSRVPDLLTA